MAVGCRRIYYDQHGSEALICSDSEEELLGVQPEGVKYEFSTGEDRLLRLAVQEYGISSEVIDTLTQFVGGTTLEIQERCNLLIGRDHQMEKLNSKCSIGEGTGNNLFLEKSLSTALDSFDNLFCRKCLLKSRIIKVIQKFPLPPVNKKKKKKKQQQQQFLSSFRLHYNWCSSQLLMLSSHVYYDASWNSVIPMVDYVRMQDHCDDNQDDDRDDGLLRYLQWLEEKGNDQSSACCSACTNNEMEP